MLSISSLKACLVFGSKHKCFGWVASFCWGSNGRLGSACISRSVPFGCQPFPHFSFLLLIFCANCFSSLRFFCGSGNLSVTDFWSWCQLICRTDEKYATLSCCLLFLSHFDTEEWHGMAITPASPSSILKSELYEEQNFMLACYSCYKLLQVATCSIMFHCRPSSCRQWPSLQVTSVFTASILTGPTWDWAPPMVLKLRYVLQTWLVALKLVHGEI